ncbi:MAG TPA: class I SAM-dependent methyltransferase, partial [Glaciihabitans sp.]|nr:class I SAM-dependent methyltransferase [Glaciihabitans sp.]
MTEASPYSEHEFVVEGSNDSWSNLYRFIPVGARVLDVGCSTGNLGAALESTKNCTVVGIDIFESDIAIAKTRITRAEVRDVSNPDDLADLGQFDVIVFADVLEHLLDPHAALLACAGILAEGGTIVYSIPNMAHLSVRLDLLAGHFGYTQTGILDHTHVHFYDRDAVDTLFADAGFTITDERSVSIEYPPRFIEDRLADLGLTASPAFHSMLKSTEADVLQLVGRAVPSGAPAAQSLSVRDRTFPPLEISAYATALEAQNEAVRQEADATRETHRLTLEAALHSAEVQRHRADSFEAQLAAVQQRLTQLKSHPLQSSFGYL